MDYRSKLKALGLSVTPVRLAVLDAIVKHPHSEAQYIFEIVQERLQTTSLQAIYKNLNVLVEYGLVAEIKPMGMSALYETRIGDNHHHLVCKSCGLVEDTNCLDSAPCLTSTDDKGFKIYNAEIIFWGLCPKCQKKF